MGSPASEIQKLLQAARLHLAQGQHHEAVTQTTEAIRLDARQAAAYLVRAEALRRLKHRDRARADLAVAIRLDPENHAPCPTIPPPVRFLLQHRHRLV
jgi:Flp pilus assembly protein TadD